GGYGALDVQHPGLDDGPALGVDHPDGVAEVEYGVTPGRGLGPLLDALHPAQHCHGRDRRWRVLPDGADNAGPHPRLGVSVLLQVLLSPRLELRRVVDLAPLDDAVVLHTIVVLDGLLVTKHNLELREAL